jgi:hypothetical protein
VNQGDEGTNNLTQAHQPLEKPDAGPTEGQGRASEDVAIGLVHQPAKNPDFPSLLGQMTGVRGVPWGPVLEAITRGISDERDRARADLATMTADRDRWRNDFHRADKENAVLRQKLAARWVEILGGAIFGSGLGAVLTMQKSQAGIAAIVIGLVMIAVCEFVARGSKS